MTAYISKLTLEEKINTGEYCYRTYTVEVAQSDTARPSGPADMMRLVQAVTSLDPTRSIPLPDVTVVKKVLPDESQVRKVLSPKK